jgi:Family of unknown function (DUF6544)
MRIVSFTITGFALLLGGLQLWRWSDRSHAEQTWQSLARQVATPEPFDASMVAALPEPARRYFLFTIKSGTPIATVAEIQMNGALGLGTKDDPRYLPMRAEQILALPNGFVWKLSAGSGLMQISGSDGYDGKTSWVRFWLAQVVPIVRSGGNADHARAAFGRMVAEAAFWAPAALLPQFGTSWEAVDVNTARATVTGNGMTQTVDITMTRDGRPTKVVIPRWTDANDEKVFRLQPFGGYLAEFREFAGYTLPTRVEGGNWIDTPDYFPFYRASVKDVHFTVPAR